MPIVTGFGWPLECEVHVLSGMSTVPLLDLLRVTIDNEISRLVGSLSPSEKIGLGIGRIKLEPQFKPSSASASVATGNGVDFEFASGRVIAKPTAAGHRRMRNFLVRAKLEIAENKHIKDTREMPVGDDQSTLGLPVVTEGGGNGGSAEADPAAPGSRWAQAVIRVHVHDGIRSCWPTPGKLRIPTGSGGALPRLLAEFDDGVVADISEWSTVIDGLSIAWSSANASRVQVDATTGRLRSTSAPSSNGVEVRATLSHTSLPQGSIRSTPLQAHVVGAWSQPRPVKFIAGPGPSSYESATNLLFVAEGFLANEEAAFHGLVAFLAEVIVTREDMQPFKLLRHSINFWSLFVASEESGTTLLSEHIPPKAAASFRLNEKIDDVITDIFGPAPQGESAEESAYRQALKVWILNFGLPAPADFSNSESDEHAFERLLPLVGADFEHPFDFIASSNDFAAWRQLAQRSLIESRDTLFAVQSGSRPFIGRKPASSPTLDDRRISGNDIAELVGALYFDLKESGATKRLPVGAVWARSLSASPGKDAGQVCILSRAASFGAATTVDPMYGPQYLIAKLWHYSGIDSEKAATQPGKPTFTLQPGAVDPRHGSSPNVALPVVHEFGHVFGLVDEYGGKRPTELVSPRKYPNGQWRYTVLHRPGDPVKQFDPVLMSLPSLSLWPSRIQWSAWSRLKAAGELFARPVFISPTVVLVKLRPGHAKPFATDQFVRLRQRPLLDVQYLAASSPAMRITHVDFEKDEVHLEPGTSFTPANTVDFDVVATKPSPLLILPRRRTGTTSPERRELPLVAPEILTHIGESGGPLNAEAGNAAISCTPAESPVAAQFPRNLPATLTRTPAMSGPLFRWQNIVGLYQGGLGLDCGAYHPAGDCMMRGAIEEIRPVSMATTSTTEFRPFCHVCRYWLVDRIDPSKHRELDDLYDPYYPGQRPYE